MSSLYYQQRQHEQHQHETARQQQYGANHNPHQHYKSHTNGYAQQVTHHSRHYCQPTNHPHPQHAQYSQRNDQISTSENMYAAASSSIATVNHGNGSKESSQQHLFAQAQDQVLETLAAMISQEFRSYRLDDYFSSSIPKPLDGKRQQNVIHGAWREKICQWSYNVVDHFDLPREIVSISLNYFDRYMATLTKPEQASCSSQLPPGDLALLASLGTLHLATKVHATNHNDYDPQRGPMEEQHHKVPSLSTLANLSRGQFGPASICEMEKLLLVALDWKLHPPTLYALVTLLLKLVPSTNEDRLYGLSSAIAGELFEVAMYVAELSVCDAFFVEKHIPSSTIALAAILMAMDDLLQSQEDNSLMVGFSASNIRGSGCFTHEHKAHFLHMCSERLGLACKTPLCRISLQESLERLRSMYRGASATAQGASVSAAVQSSKEEPDSHSPNNPQDELLQSNRQRTNSYAAPTSPSSIADMSLSTINSNMQSITETTTTLGNTSSVAAKRNDSLPTRNESMVSSIACSSISMGKSYNNHEGCGRETPNSDGQLSLNNLRYSPSPPSRNQDEDEDLIGRTNDEDPMIIAVRQQVNTSLSVSNGGEPRFSVANSHHPMEQQELRLTRSYDDDHQQEQRRHRQTNGGTMMSCSPIMSSR